jgi:hypothetical protein
LTLRSLPPTDLFSPPSPSQSLRPRRRESALSLIGNSDGRFQIRPAARAAGEVIGDLFG